VASQRFLALAQKTDAGRLLSDEGHACLRFGRAL